MTDEEFEALGDSYVRDESYEDFDERWMLIAAERRTLRDALGQCANRTERMRAIMRRENVKIDDLDDPMQKFAFTLYTELCEVEDIAQKTLDASTGRSSRREVPGGAGGHRAG